MDWFLDDQMLSSENSPFLGDLMMRSKKYNIRDLTWLLVRCFEEQEFLVMLAWDISYVAYQHVFLSSLASIWNIYNNNNWAMVMRWLNYWCPCGKCELLIGTELVLSIGVRLWIFLWCWIRASHRIALEVSRGVDIQYMPMMVAELVHNTAVVHCCGGDWCERAYNWWSSLSTAIAPECAIYNPVEGLP